MRTPNPEPPPRILVADDARDVADVYCVLLSSAGYRVQRAYDGLTALSLAKVTKPDLAILNFSMPGLTGIQVLRELREAGSATRVIITSGTSAFNELAFLALREGAEACVQQPCPTPRLLSMVARVFGAPAPRP
ncbi:MAG TPA: response regulator [Elusimicrobiota bacterium]|jgi:CheY-like chemotaxis protein|nr:response regulator [Elusimicrobiota bacterium]